MCIHCEVKKDGRQARLLNLSPAACPYPVGSIAALDWLQGWINEDTEFAEAARALELKSIRERRVAR